MSHFAKIDSNNIVVKQTVAEQDFINTGRVGDAFLWVQYSYNSKFRGIAPSIGDIWDETRQRFIHPQPYPSWILDNTFNWQPPKPHPLTTIDNYSTEAYYPLYTWDEETTNWKEVI
jgi:hypothetical protein